MKEAMTTVAETLFKGHKSKTDCLLLPVHSLALILWQEECLCCLQMQKTTQSSSQLKSQQAFNIFGPLSAQTTAEAFTKQL